jgi:hypothetical protein
MIEVELISRNSNSCEKVEFKLQNKNLGHINSEQKKVKSTIF